VNGLEEGARKLRIFVLEIQICNLAEMLTETKQKQNENTQTKKKKQN